MGKIGFVFPGQGSQSVGMGKDLYDKYPQAQDIYHHANEVLGFDVSEISFHGPEDTLKQTQFTQPALFVQSYILFTLLDQSNIKADLVAGHSLGEFSALLYAGAYTFEDGLRLVKERGRLMGEAGLKQPGKMAAIIGLSGEDVIKICIEAEIKGMVQPANFNSPGQIVISGSTEGVAHAILLAKEKGAKRALELPVSGAFHSPLMEAAAKHFKTILNEVRFQNIRIPVYANVTANPVSSCDEIKDLLCQQLTHSVRWIETIENMIHDGITKIIEVGPGKVLTGLIKRINKNIEVMSCNGTETFETLVQSIL